MFGLDAALVNKQFKRGTHCKLITPPTLPSGVWALECRISAAPQWSLWVHAITMYIYINVKSY